MSDTRSSGRVIARVLLAAAAIILIAQCVALWPDLQGDTFIHYTFAKRLARGEFFHYNAGEPSRASSSPAWTLLLGILHLFGGPPRLIVLSKVASLAFALLALAAAAELGVRLTGEQIAGGCAALALAVTPAFATWTIRAMETAFFVALVFAVFVVALGPGPARTRPRAALLGLLLGACTLGRPEGLLLAGLVTAIMAWRKHRQEPGFEHLAVALGTAAVVVTPYALWLVVHFGSPFPSSVARIEFARQWARRHGPLWVNFDYVRLLRDRYPAYLVLAGMGIGASMRQTQTRVLAVALGSWLAVSAVLYTIVVPGTYGQRYFLPGFAVVPVLASASVLWIPLRLRVAAPFVFALALSPDLRRNLTEFRETRNYVHDVIVPWDLPARREMADWVHDHLPPDAIIGAKEVDQLAYFGERRVLSLDGTLDTRALPYLRTGHLIDFLIAAGATHVLVEENLYDAQPSLQASDLAALARPSLTVGTRVVTPCALFTLVHRTRYAGPPIASRDVYWYLYQVVPGERNPTSTPAIRSPARPSHSSGIRAARPPFSRRTRKAASSPPASAPTSVFVPCVTVTGRSVLSRSVKQGTPRTVVSSWMPPESVRTRAAWSSSARNSR